MLTDVDFQRIVHYVQSNYGIDLSDKKVLITGRMDNFLIRNGYSSYGDYMAKVEVNPDGPEAKNLVNFLTTNHTYFMRESSHFDYFSKVILPELRKNVKDHDLRIWSAASSSGEEAYTLAMLLMDFFGAEHFLWDTTVLATDISTRALEFATRGIYTADQLQPLPKIWLQRYFQRLNENEYQATKALRDQVLFRQFNLMDPFIFKRKFHVIFLRNVMIYFSDKTRYELLEKIYNVMEDGGYLFVGTTEPIDKNKTKFKYIGSSIYRK